MKKLLSEQLGEIIERLQESDRKMQERLNSSIQRTQALLAEMKSDLGDELG